jgi:elongation factor P hydroxylase
MLEDNLLWLVKWRDNHCDGDWEHSYGISIEILNNSGWIVEIDIQETELEQRKFKEIGIERTDKDWIFCKVENGSFRAKCSTHNLIEAIQIFRCWGESNIL